MSAEKNWESVGPPPVGLFVAEQARALGEFAAFRERRRLRKQAPRGDGHPVLVLPGFLAGDYSTRPLRGFLRDLCYDARGWKLGTNLGPNKDIMKRMIARVQSLHERHDRKLSLVGWSLGGIYARELARAMPDKVRCVVTMGSPFRDISATHATRLIALRPGGRPVHESGPIREMLARPIPVPCTSIYSKTDGIVHWQSCLQDESDLAENVEVHCSHTGMGFHPEVLAVVADRLAQPEGQWRPYEKQARPKRGAPAAEPLERQAQAAQPGL
jgi:pimeloyl-ACP methyl ester carboxylesterase